jgi:hypothetical protein
LIQMTVYMNKFTKYNIYALRLNYQDEIQDNGTDEPIETGSGETENFD